MIEAKVTLENGRTATMCAGSIIELIRSLEGLHITALETCEITPEQIKQGKSTTAKEWLRGAGE